MKKFQETIPGTQQVGKKIPLKQQLLYKNKTVSQYITNLQTAEKSRNTVSTNIIKKEKLYNFYSLI